MIDQQDFSAVVQRQQDGRTNQFWPILIKVAGMGLGVPTEINIAPCDHIWMPTTYEKSYGVNPFQQAQIDQAADPACGPLPTIAGYNLPDIYDGDNQVYLTSATIFSLRFNSPNNPWLLFGLSRQLGPISDFEPFGQGGCMRSITGPISRMWIQVYQYATAELVTEATLGDFSQIVLMSMLGMNQQTEEFVRFNSEATNAVSQGSIFGGGYVTPQLTTLERLRLAARIARGKARPR